MKITITALLTSDILRKTEMLQRKPMKCKKYKMKLNQDRTLNKFRLLLIKPVEVCDGKNISNVLANCLAELSMNPNLLLQTHSPGGGMFVDDNVINNR